MQLDSRGRWTLQRDSGLWDQGVSPHFCDTRDFFCMNTIVFGKPSVVSQKWSFPTALKGMVSFSYTLHFWEGSPQKKAHDSVKLRTVNNTQTTACASSRLLLLDKRGVLDTPQ